MQTTMALWFSILLTDLENFPNYNKLGNILNAILMVSPKLVETMLNKFTIPQTLPSLVPSISKLQESMEYLEYAMMQSTFR